MVEAVSSDPVANFFQNVFGGNPQQTGFAPAAVPHLHGKTWASRNSAMSHARTRLKSSPVLAHEHGHEAAPSAPHGRHHAALKHAKIAEPTHYAASIKDIHEAIHKAAADTGISANLAGGIAHLESMFDGGRLNNSINGYSEGLFQMQRSTSDGVMTRHGAEIAAKLEAANADGRYTDIIGDLKAHKLPSKAHYNSVILDPYFNSQLGCNLIKDNAAAHGLSTNGTQHLTEIYSMHLTGRMITPGEQRSLTQMGMTHGQISPNAPVLGIAKGADPATYDPTGGVAYAALSKYTHQHLDAFTSQDKSLGLYQADASPPAVHKAHDHPGKAPKVHHNHAFHH